MNTRLLNIRGKKDDLNDVQYEGKWARNTANWCAFAQNSTSGLIVKLAGDATHSESRS
jgi:hypothetical protein